MTKLLAAEAPIKPPNAFQPKKALVLFNAKAGHVVDADGDKLIAALTELGVEQCTMVGPEKLDKKLLQRAKRFDRIGRRWHCQKRCGTRAARRSSAYPVARRHAQHSSARALWRHRLARRS
jgi:hypothetical protein